MAKLPTPAAGPFAATKAFSDVVEAVKEWQLAHDKEETKRAEISAVRDVMLAQIQSRRDVLVEYLRCTFTERADTLSMFFERLDMCIASGDTRGVEQMVAGIVSTIKASPLGDVATLENRMNDGSFTLKLGG